MAHVREKVAFCPACRRGFYRQVKQLVVLPVYFIDHITVITDISHYQDIPRFLFLFVYGTAVDRVCPYFFVRNHQGTLTADIVPLNQIVKQVRRVVIRDPASQLIIEILCFRVPDSHVQLRECIKRTLVYIDNHLLFIADDYELV
jgi:hypothetical protein